MGQFFPEVRVDLASKYQRCNTQIEYEKLHPQGDGVSRRLPMKVIALHQREWQLVQGIEANYCE